MVKRKIKHTTKKKWTSAFQAAKKTFKNTKSIIKAKKTFKKQALNNARRLFSQVN